MVCSLSSQAEIKAVLAGRSHAEQLALLKPSKAHVKELTHGRVRDPMPHEVGLQVPRGLHTEVMVGIAAPLLALPLLLLWLTRKLTAEDLAEAILRTIAHGCRDQNPRRTTAEWGRLS
jgi:hypothetical protein